MTELILGLITLNLMIRYSSKYQDMDEFENGFLYGVTNH